MGEGNATRCARPTGTPVPARLVAVTDVSCLSACLDKLRGW
jgi:hypothetical protein